MRLRRRLALTAVVVATPVVVAMFWLDARARHEAAAQNLRSLALGHMLRTGERERCEADPVGWGGRPLGPPGPPDDGGPPGRGEGPPPAEGPPGPPRDGPPHPPGDRPGGDAPILFAYDAQLHAMDPRAPAIDAAPASGWWPGSEVWELVPMPWAEGPCAQVLARGTTNPSWIGGILPENPTWILAVGAVIVGLWLSVGPVVARMRRLTHAVQASARRGFTVAVPVEGDDEVAELARAFADATSEVNAQLAANARREEALREYVANTTHDVMIPLTVLQSHLASIERQRDAGEAVDAEVLRGAMDEAHYLGALMRNLAVAAKIDAAQPEVDRSAVDLGALVERVLGRHRTIARQRGVAFDGAVPEADTWVLGDVTLLEQALNNVVYNAIRHNRPEGHVALTLDRLAGGRFRVRVVDDGPGIADDELTRLVERGFRTEAARARTPDGQGLGLNIALRVAKLLDLELAFSRSEYGGLQVDLQGTTTPRPAARDTT